MRVWSAETKKFSDTAKRTDRLPTRPSAVYLYNRGRTHLLWLDFDSKRYGRNAVEADMAAATSWLTQCGGVVIADRSTSGGGHLLCPLAIGTSASLDEMVPIVRLLAARLPTLDITPNTNADTGCMTPPGSPCREGGHRQLDGDLGYAMEALTTRSEADLLPRLSMLLGALKDRTSPRRGEPAPAETPADHRVYTDGEGDNRRLATAYVRNDPLPPDVLGYATRAIISPTRPTWQSNHEARMSVVTQAIARGHSLSSLRDMIASGGPWEHGLGAAYRRYGQRADVALARDVTRATDWLITNVVSSSPPRHKRNYTQGGQRGYRGPLQLRVWLANALSWADGEYAGKRYRWTVHAVLQAVAFHALVAGEQRSGTWVVGVGGRSLSLSAGLLSDDTIWRVLADLRDRPGSPLILVRQHIGTEPDVYALTSQNVVHSDMRRSERVRIEPVHDAWVVLGHHLRRVYELVAHHGLTDRADVYAAATLVRATGDAMIADLQTAGLITSTGRGTIGPGTHTLDDIADRHHLDETRRARLAKHREERAAWRSWLCEREEQRAQSLPITETRPCVFGASAQHTEPADPDYAAWLSAVLATGPPDAEPSGDELHAIELVADLLGGRIVA
ncbi:hypothetical protein [Mycolicibacterium arabiense]